MPWKPNELIYGLTFHATSIDLCIILKCNIYIQPVSEVLAYLHVQISPISCNVVGSILQVPGKNTDTAIVGYWWTGVGGTPRPVLLTGAKKFGVPD